MHLCSNFKSFVFCLQHVFGGKKQRRSMPEPRPLKISAPFDGMRDTSRPVGISETQWEEIKLLKEHMAATFIGDADERIISTNNINGFVCPRLPHSYPLLPPGVVVSSLAERKSSAVTA